MKIERISISDFADKLDTREFDATLGAGPRHIDGTSVTIWPAPDGPGIYMVHGENVFMIENM